MKTALFTGSFDPFTIGHADLVSRLLPLFDRIIIVIGQNQDKQRFFPLQDTFDRINTYYNNENKIEVVVYNGLTIDAARQYGADVIVKGVRNEHDYLYEKAQAVANKELAGIETLLLNASPKFEHISSSFVRDLYKHNYDISKYIV